MLSPELPRTVATPWPVGKLRSELDRLTGELARWQRYPHFGLGEEFCHRANRILTHLRGQPHAPDVEWPEQFSFERSDLGKDRLTIDPESVQRMLDWVKKLNDLLPAPRVPDVVGGDGVFQGTVWPEGRIRIELRRLLDDLNLWRGYPHVGVAADLARRANRVLTQLRSRPGAPTRNYPSNWQFDSSDLGPTGVTLTDAATTRLTSFIEALAEMVPGFGPGARTALALSGLHPRVQSAAAFSWREGRMAAAVAGAAETVCARLRQISGLSGSGEELVEAALNHDAPKVLIAGQDTRAGRSAQNGCRHLALGLVQSATGLARPAAPPVTADRAYEMLALASLVLHQLEFARVA